MFRFVTLAFVGLSLMMTSCDHSKNEVTPQPEQGPSAYELRAQPVRDFIEISEGKELFVDYIPAKPGQPTIVLLNGLTYRLGTWDEFVAEFKGSGIGILRYDMTGQGEMLRKYAPIKTTIPYESQVEELALLLTKLELRRPVTLGGLSYGGVIGFAFTAKYPTRVANLVAMAPYASAIPTQDEWIRSTQPIS